MSLVTETSKVRAALSQREPTAAPADQDGLMFELGTSYRVDLETTEQGLGVKRGGIRPQLLRRGGARAADAVRGQSSSRDRLHAWVVDGRLGAVGVRGQESGLGRPDLRAVRHGTRKPLSDAVNTFRVLYLGGELLYPGRDCANHAGWMRVTLGTAHRFYVLLESTCREQDPGFRRCAR